MLKVPMNNHILSATLITLFKTHIVYFFRLYINVDRKHELRRAIRRGLCSCAVHASVVVMWRACFCRAAAHNQRALVVLISRYISYQQLFLPGAQFKKKSCGESGGGIGKKIQNFDHKTTTSKHLPPSFLLITGLPACFRFLIFFAALPSPPPLNITKQ